MAVGAATAAVGLGEASGQEVLRQPILAQQLVLALSPAGSLGAFGFGLHLKVIIHAEEPEGKDYFANSKIWWFAPARPSR